MSVRDLIILGCSSQQPTRFRNHGAYLLRWNNEGHLFDPGEGTQRQFIFANIAPTVVTRIYISHFHGDHCLGLPSMLMRLNLDKVTHPIHCYYPASGKKYFDRLRNSTIYHETIHVVEHPVSEEGIVHDDGKFIVEAYFLKHGVETIGWRITEPTTRKFDKNKITELNLRGEAMRTLIAEGQVNLEGNLITLDQISHFRKGDTFAYLADTVECPKASVVAQGAKLLLSESTYLDEHAHLAKKHHHLTAIQAAKIARESGVDHLVLTHFSARYPDTRAHAKEAQTIHLNTTAAHDLKVIPFHK